MLKFGQTVAQCQKSTGLVIGDPLATGVYSGNVKKVFVSELAETWAVGFYMS